MTHWFVPALPTCRYFPRRMRYPSATPSTPRLPGRCLVCPMTHCTVFRGHGATVLSPLKTSPARGRVSAAYSSRRPTKRLYSLPGCAGANRRRPRCFFGGGCVFGRLAQLFSLRAASSRLTPSPPPACVLSGGLGDPGRRRCAAHPVHPRSARAGPAAVRTALPCPVASSCSLTTVTQRQLRPQHAAADQQCTVLDARPSARWCHRAHPAAPPGRSFLDAVQTDADGTPNHRPDLGAAWLHLVVRSPAVSGVQAYLSPGADARCLYDTTHLSTKETPS